MPRYDKSVVTHNVGHFGFSAIDHEELGASEYTLVTVAVDYSGSVMDFYKEMEACIKEVVRACQHSPRAENLLIRIVRFSGDTEEVHGFRLLSQCNLDEYDNILINGGMTALNAATIDAVEGVTNYGQTLTENDFEVNGIVFVVTDGLNNQSPQSVDSVKKAFQNAVKSESLESLVSVLVGVNLQDPTVEKGLNDFQTEVGFTAFQPLEDASAKTLAKLAQFISKSISSQSQALGTGGPSSSITF